MLLACSSDVSAALSTATTASTAPASRTARRLPPSADRLVSSVSAVMVLALCTSALARKLQGGEGGGGEDRAGTWMDQPIV